MSSNANLMDTVDRAMHPAREGPGAAARARAKFEAAMSSAKASLRNGTERVKTTARHAADTTDQYVHTNPWAAVGIAAAAGAAIAVLVRTRIQRSTS